MGSISCSPIRGVVGAGSDRVGKAGVTGPDQFKALAVTALRRLQRMPHIVRGFFADPNLAYITNTV